MFSRNGLKCSLQVLKSQHPAGIHQSIKSYCQHQPLTYLERKLNRQNLNEQHNEEENATDRLLKAHQYRKLYDTHQQLNTFQTILLAAGSSVGALLDPYRDGSYLCNHLTCLTSLFSFIAKNNNRVLPSSCQVASKEDHFEFVQIAQFAFPLN